MANGCSLPSFGSDVSITNCQAAAHVVHDETSANLRSLILKTPFGFGG